MISKPSN